MDNLDDTLQKAIEVFDTARKKTGDAFNLQKMKFELAGKKSELNKAYASLGKICYSSAVKDEDLPANAFDTMKIITDIIAEIEELTLLISKAQGKIICPKCNSGVPAGSTYCNYCGQQINK